MPKTWEDYPQLLKADIEFLRSCGVDRPGDVETLTLGFVLRNEKLREILTLMGCRVVMKK